MNRTKKNLFTATILLALLLFSTAAFASNQGCRWCGSGGYGYGCPYSPYRVHEHINTEQYCEFCGSGGYGRGCSYSPFKAHRHGHGAGRCIWCGSTSFGRGCPFSPSGSHEK